VSPARVLILTSLRLLERFAVGFNIASRAPGICVARTALERTRGAGGNSCAHTVMKPAHRKIATQAKIKKRVGECFRVIALLFLQIGKWFIRVFATSRILMLASNLHLLVQIKLNVMTRRERL
jgi:hypothetical protein